MAFDSLAPGFVIALPQLRDPNFHRTVVLLTAHAEDGAMGFIINRKLPATVAEVVDGLDVPWRGDPEEPVWGGGPVMPQSGFVLFDRPQQGEALAHAERVADGLWLSASVETLRLLGEKPPRSFRLLLGHAGWAPGQLEAELLQGAWLSLPVDAKLVFDTPADEIWEACFRRLGFHPGSIVPGHGVQ